MSQTIQKQGSETNNSADSEEPPSWKEIASEAWNNKLSLLYEAGKLESGNYKRFYRLNYILMTITTLVTTIPLHIPLLLVIASELTIRVYNPDSLVSMHLQSICNRVNFLIFAFLVFFFSLEYTIISILVASVSIIYWKIKNDTML